MDFKNISQLISSLLLNWHSCYLKEKEWWLSKTFSGWKPIFFYIIDSDSLCDLILSSTWLRGRNSGKVTATSNNMAINSEALVGHLSNFKSTFINTVLLAWKSGHYLQLWKIWLLNWFWFSNCFWKSTTVLNLLQMGKGWKLLWSGTYLVA